MISISSLFYNYKFNFFLGLIDDKIDLSPNIKLLSFILIFFIISYLDKGDLLIDILRFNDLNFV